MTKSRRIDLLALIIYVVLLIPATLFFKVSFLVSTTLFFVVPSVYLALRGPLPWKRIFFASFLFTFLTFQLDFLAELNKAWVLSYPIFATKIFNVVTIDIMIWGFLWALVILIFYEHFSEHDRSSKISGHFKILFMASLISCAIILGRFSLAQTRLNLSYTYLLIGLASFLIFLLIMLKIKKPYFIFHKFLLASFFFAFLHLTHELTSLKIGQWYFPGQYLANINILGLIFPIEEFVFWILLSAMVVLALYEYFVDDEK